MDMGITVQNLGAPIAAAPVGVWKRLTFKDALIAMRVAQCASISFIIHCIDCNVAESCEESYIKYHWVTQATFKKKT
jgi:hypothetical protein